MRTVRFVKHAEAHSRDSEPECRRPDFGSESCLSICKGELRKPGISVQGWLSAVKAGFGQRRRLPEKKKVNVSNFSGGLRRFLPVRHVQCLLLSICMGTPVIAEDTVQYGVKVDLNWETDGAPADPHWSRLIAFAHSGKYSLFKDGDTASSGLALVATNGRVSVLEAELAEARRRGRVGEHVVLPGIEGVGKFTFELALDDRRSHVAFATMLAPSPDWFSGISGVPMRDAQGNWIEVLNVPLWVWDAGADSGSDFDSPNMPTQPRQSVRLLTHPSFLRVDGMRPIGHVTIEKLPKQAD